MSAGQTPRSGPSADVATGRFCFSSRQVLQICHMPPENELEVYGCGNWRQFLSFGALKFLLNQFGFQKRRIDPAN
jgi:hypothetical protein